MLAIVPSHHQSPSFVFTEFVNDTGWENPIYVAAIGLLLAQYTFCGYDASAHLSEETSNASVTAAQAASCAPSGSRGSPASSCWPG